MAGTKKCKYCKQDIDKGATICPYCRKKQGIGCGTALIVIIAFIVLIIIIARMGSSKKTNSSSVIVSTTAGTTTSVAESTDENNETSAPDETTAPSETTSAETEYPQMNGFVIFEKKGESDSYGCTVNGIVGNATGRDCSYVQITIGFYDENGIKVASGLDNILNLKSGDIWKFSAYGYGSGIKKYQIEEIYWY